MTGTNPARVSRPAVPGMTARVPRRRRLAHSRRMWPPEA